MFSQKAKVALSLISLSILSFLITYYFTARYFSTDGDVINSAMAWTEINQHGLSAMKTWKPTLDNWFFAVYPVHFLVFWIFGNPTVAMLTIISAAQASLCAITAALIAYSITKNSWSLLLIIFFSALSYFAYILGFVAHPFSHNAVNLYGLICVLLLVHRNQSVAITVLVCFLSLMAATSDPWYVVAYLLPFTLYSVYLNIMGDKKAWHLTAIYAITMALFFSKIIQKHFNIPVAKFTFADTEIILLNTEWFFMGYGRLFNIFFTEKTTPYILTACLFVLITIGSVFKKIKKEENILLSLSLLGVASSFIVGEPEKQEYSVRFLVNIIYITPVIWLINTKKKWSLLIGFILALCMASSLWSHSLHNGGSHDSEMKEQIEFMKQHDLNFGYGAYWGAKANPVTWLSGGSVIIRPMMTDPRTGMIYWKSKHSQAFDSWYRQHKGRTFIAVTQDAETCQSVVICLNGMQKQFGKPDEKLTFKNITFLVYDKGIKINDTE